MNTNPVGIFWDIENCAVPRDKLASGIIAHIRNTFVLNRLNNREFEFLIACDVTRIRSDTRDDINKAGGVTLAHVNGGYKNAADEKLKESMKRFVDTHSLTGNNLTLVLISGDIDFVNDLRGYQTRLGCIIILIHSPKCSQQFKLGWNEVWTFHDVCAVVPINSVPKETILGIPSLSDYQHPGPNEGYEGTNLNRGRDDSYGDRGRGRGRGRPRGFLNTRGARGQHSFQNQSSYREPDRQYNQNPEKFDNMRAQQPQSNIHHRYEGYNRGRGSAVRLGGQSSGSVPNLSDFYPKTDSVKLDPTAPNAPIERQEFILMVSGLPGKMDFHILKDHLQEQANQVYGRVKYVNNGQAFITFQRKENADRAIELFHGKEVYGNSLNVKLAQQIPFDKPRGRSDRNIGSEGYNANVRNHSRGGKSRSGAEFPTNNTNSDAMQHSETNQKVEEEFLLMKLDDEDKTAVMNPSNIPSGSLKEYSSDAKINPFNDIEVVKGDSNHEVKQKRQRNPKGNFSEKSQIEVKPKDDCSQGMATVKDHFGEKLQIEVKPKVINLQGIAPVKDSTGIKYGMPLPNPTFETVDRFNHISRGLKPEKPYKMLKAPAKQNDSCLIQ